jgi:cytidylate kinase
MPGVTISAGYGAGGSIIAPAVANRLGLPLLDRAISSRVAAQLHVSVQEAEGGDFRRSLVERFLTVLTPLAGGALCAGTDAAPPDAIPPPDDAVLFREQAEAIMTDALSAGAVILGRAGGAAFRDAPDVLRVRLFGSPEARIAQASRIEDVDAPTARQRLPEVDRARAQYVRRLYGVSIDDPGLYQLQIDSTAVVLDACADLIAAAYRALTPSPGGVGSGAPDRSR